MKPTIYLGLGGTGNLAISCAKKLYEEEFGQGKIPQSVAFVTVDFQTDMDSDPGLATDITSNFIKIDIASNPREFYRVRRENHGQYAWMFEGNSNNIDNRISRGAKSVRTTGRLYTEMVLDSVMNRLKTVVDNVTYVEHGADVAAGVNIHMVMSIAGGTGAGSFITLANAIRQTYGNAVNLYGYGVTHSVFRAMDPSGVKTPNVELNAISSIIDLDYLQTATGSNPIEIELGGKKVLLRDPAFDGFYVIDNTSEKGYTLKTVKSMCEVIGTCLYACGAEAGDKVENIINNVGPKEGKNHVGPKLGWVQGLGACSIVYDGASMSEAYSLKAAIELIRKMQQEGPNVQQQALKWTNENNIQEDGDEFNQLTDSIYSPKQLQLLKLPNVSSEDTEAANKETVKKYFVSLVEFPTDEVINARLSELKAKIAAKIQGYLAQDCGVGNSIKFLKSLQGFFEKYKLEMAEEARMINNDKEELLDAFNDKAFAEYKDRKHGKLTFNSKSRNQDLLDDIVGRPAKEILKLTHDAKRRSVAESMYVALISYVEVELSKLTDLNHWLSQLSTRYEERLVIVQGMKKDALVFECDLSYNERVNLEIESSEVVVADFTKGNSMTEIASLDALNDVILAYTSGLEKAVAYKNRLLVDVIDGLSDEEYKKLKREIELKSARWLKVNDRGQVVNVTGKAVEDAVAKNWVISFYKKNEGYQCRLQKDPDFAPGSKPDYLPIDRDVAKQRMLLCRIDGSIIPYCIDVFSEMAMDRYEAAIRGSLNGDAVFNPHFDRILFEQMKSEDFKLKPEMKNEAIFYWVAGHFFGWDTIKEEERIMNVNEKGEVTSADAKELADHTKYIRYYKKKYMYWDEKSKVGADKKWQNLGNTTQRDKAYNTFKTVVLADAKEDYKKIIRETYMMKKAWWDSEIKRVIDAGLEEYINKVVCSDKNSVTYMSSNSGDYRLIQDEFEFLSKDFLNQLGNLK